MGTVRDVRGKGGTSAQSRARLDARAMAFGDRVLGRGAVSAISGETERVCPPSDVGYPCGGRNHADALGF